MSDNINSLGLLGGGTALGSSITKNTSFDVVVNKNLLNKSFSELTDQELLEVVTALDNNLITTADLNWQIGESRTVHLSAMTATEVGESHVAQDVEFVLMDSTLQGMTSADVSKPLHFVVGLKDCLKEIGYMTSNGVNAGWDGSSRRRWCNNVFINSLPSTFRNCFRQFKWELGKGTEATSELVESIDTFALPCEKQVFGVRHSSQSTEAKLYTGWTYYQTVTNRIKKVNGNVSEWALSSGVSGSWWDYCIVYDDGSNSTSGGAGNRGISPFGCI